MSNSIEFRKFVKERIEAGELHLLKDMYPNISSYLDVANALRYMMSPMSQQVSTTNPTSYQPTYIYPDGTYKTSKPIDGEVFIIWDKNMDPESQWIYYASDAQWHNMTNKVPGKTGSEAFGKELDLVQEFERLVAQNKPVVCECGAHATGSNKHSSWCGMYSLQP